MRSVTLQLSRPTAHRPQLTAQSLVYLHQNVIPTTCSCTFPTLYTALHNMHVAHLPRRLATRKLELYRRKLPANSHDCLSSCLYQGHRPARCHHHSTSLAGSGCCCTHQCDKVRPSCAHDMGRRNIFIDRSRYILRQGRAQDRRRHFRVRCTRRGICEEACMRQLLRWSDSAQLPVVERAAHA